MSFKEIVDARTHARTDGRTPDIEGSQKLFNNLQLILTGIFLSLQVLTELNCI